MILIKEWTNNVEISKHGLSSIDEGELNKLVEEKKRSY